MGDPEKAPGSWLWNGLALTIEVTWGVNQRTKDVPLYLSFPLYICLSNNNKKNFLSATKESLPINYPYEKSLILL